MCANQNANANKAKTKNVIRSTIYNYNITGLIAFQRADCQPNIAVNKIGYLLCVQPHTKTNEKSYTVNTNAHSKTPFTYKYTTVNLTELNSSIIISSNDIDH